jgi:hypothetical protein
VACPFFMPMEKLEKGTWPHPGRLPLGCGWSGHCAAPGHEGEIPSEEELREFCNLGYAQGCVRFPCERSWDSIRFGARLICAGGNHAAESLIQVKYVCEREHRPVEHGLIEFDAVADRWVKAHPNQRLQRMAECVVESYLEKMRRWEVEPAVS